MRTLRAASYSHERIDQLTAWACVIGLHALLFALLLANKTGVASSSAHGLIGDFLASEGEAFRQKIELVPKPTSSASSASHEQKGQNAPQPVLAASMPKSADPASSSAANTHAWTMQDHRQALSASVSEESQRSASTDHFSSTTTETSLNATGDQTLRNVYLNALRGAILAHWPASGISLAGCQLSLQQEAGGKVLGAQVSGCTLSSSDRDHLEAAALMAQPLPYAGYEAVFAKQLSLQLDHE